MVFNLLQGPLIFCVSMCRIRVAFLFKKYFCVEWCCFGCFKSEEFINEDCEELATIGEFYFCPQEDAFEIPVPNLLNKYVVQYNLNYIHIQSLSILTTILLNRFIFVEM